MHKNDLKKINSSSYDLAQIFCSHVNEKNPIYHLIDSKIENSEEISDIEFESIIHLVWSLAYQRAIEDGFITEGEQKELLDIKSSYTLYHKNPSYRPIIKQFFLNQLKDLDRTQQEEKSNKSILVPKLTLLNN